MQDKLINSALLNLRKQMIRGDDTADLHHVEALLVARGVHMPAVLPAKRQDAARRGHMAVWVMRALADGPLQLSEIVDCIAVQRPEIPRKALSVRTSQALNKLLHKGMVKRDGQIYGLWSLVQQDFRPDGCLWRLEQIDLKAV